MQASSVYNCADQLHTLHFPTLIIHGKKDKTVPYYLAVEMHTGIKDSKMLAFEGSHLFFSMRERQQFIDAVTEFVK
jgi:non-heme chloroperoxidase